MWFYWMLHSLSSMLRFVFINLSRLTMNFIENGYRFPSCGIYDFISEFEFPIYLNALIWLLNMYEEWNYSLIMSSSFSFSMIFQYVSVYSQYFIRFPFFFLFLNLFLISNASSITRPNQSIYFSILFIILFNILTQTTIRLLSSS